MDMKRALDLLLGTAGLVAATPIFVGVAAYMRLSGDAGPLLYRARRVGEGGTTFSVLKIRTMREGAGGAKITMAEDPRVTPLGRRLRRYRIDELPQLINVVRGEMSMVGPRPEDPLFVDLTDPDHRRVSPHDLASPASPCWSSMTRRDCCQDPMPSADTARRSCRPSCVSTSPTSIGGRPGSTSRSCFGPSVRCSADGSVTTQTGASNLRIQVTNRTIPRATPSTNPMMNPIPRPIRLSTTSPL